MQFFAHVLVLSDIIELNRKTELFFQGRIKSVVMKMKIPVNGVLEWVLCLMCIFLNTLLNHKFYLIVI